jgi:hypothetical protein
MRARSVGRDTSSTSTTTARTRSSSTVRAARPESSADAEPDRSSGASATSHGCRSPPFRRHFADPRARAADRAAAGALTSRVTLAVGHFRTGGRWNSSRRSPLPSASRSDKGSRWKASPSWPSGDTMRRSTATSAARQAMPIGRRISLKRCLPTRPQRSRPATGGPLRCSRGSTRLRSDVSSTTPDVADIPVTASLWTTSSTRCRRQSTDQISRERFGRRSRGSRQAISRSSA